MLSPSLHFALHLAAAAVMLSAPRRLLASSTIRCNLLAPSFVVGSSKDLERPTHPFSTSSIASEKSKSKSDKAKNLERYEKAKRKQALRAEKQRSEEAKNERERLRTLARRVELEEKHEISAVGPRWALLTGAADAGLLCIFAGAR